MLLDYFALTCFLSVLYLISLVPLKHKLKQFIHHVSYPHHCRYKSHSVLQILALGTGLIQPQFTVFLHLLKQDLKYSPFSAR